MTVIEVGAEVDEATAGATPLQSSLVGDLPWSNRATGVLSLLLSLGLAAIVVEQILGSSLLSAEVAREAGLIVDAMALGIACLTFAALLARNRAAPDRLNVVTGAILGVLAVLVLPIDLVLAETTSASTTALVMATQLSIVTLSFTIVFRPVDAEPGRLRAVVTLVLATTIASSGIIDITIRAFRLDHESVLRSTLGFAAFLLAAGALRLGAVSIRAKEPRGVVLAFTLVALGVADAHASLIESGSLSSTAGKAMRLVVISAILVYTVIELRDLALRDRELALRAQNESERAADRLVTQMTFQERFVHDTRNALLAIQGGLRSLNTGSDNAMLQAVSSEVARLRTLLDAHDDDPLPVTFDLVEALQPMISCYEAGGRRIRLTANGRVHARGRPSIAAEVAQNLIENAMSHAEGEITVWIFAHDDVAEVRVADRGLGVDVDLRDAIFDHGNSSGEGSGVGLHISRRLIERHGGSIQVTDRHGGGAIFAFTLPLADAPSSAGHAPLLARQ